MLNHHRTYMNLNASLVHHQENTLLAQIAQLKEQIETNLLNKQSIKHLKDLIMERELYLNEFRIGTSTQATAIKGSMPEWLNHPNGYKA